MPALSQLHPLVKPARHLWHICLAPVPTTPAWHWPLLQEKGLWAEVGLPFMDPKIPGGWAAPSAVCCWNCKNPVSVHLALLHAVGETPGSAVAGDGCRAPRTSGQAIRSPCCISQLDKQATLCLNFPIFHCKARPPPSVYADGAKEQHVTLPPPPPAPKAEAMSAGPVLSQLLDFS